MLYRIIERHLAALGKATPRQHVLFEIAITPATVKTDAYVSTYPPFTEQEESGKSRRGIMKTLECWDNDLNKLKEERDCHNLKELHMLLKIKKI